MWINEHANVNIHISQKAFLWTFQSTGIKKQNIKACDISDQILKHAHKELFYHPNEIKASLATMNSH